MVSKIKRIALSQIQISMLMEFRKTMSVHPWVEVAGYNQRTLWSLIHGEYLEEKPTGLRISHAGYILARQIERGIEFHRKKVGPLASSVNRVLTRKGQSRSEERIHLVA